MSKKLSELDINNRVYFQTLIDFMIETEQNDLRQKLKVAQSFGLDLADKDVLKILAPPAFLEFPDETHSLANLPVSSPNQDLPSISPLKATRVYGENWIVIQNRLLNAISDLDLNERRLIMFLSPLVRKAVDIDPLQRTFVVRVKDFQEEYGIKSNRYYEELENSCISLTNKSYTFWDFYKNQKKQSKIQVSWLTKSVYQNKQGEIHVDLHNDVVEMLTVFDKANPFTKYERQMIVNLGGYGIILFELISSCMHQQHKQKSYTIEYLREKFNCVDSYSEFFNFKRYVLDKAIQDIEKHTPYRIQYEQRKKGRIVSDIIFSFENTEQQKCIKSKEVKQQLNKKNSVSRQITNEEKETNPNLLTDKQLARIVHSKKFMVDYSSMVSPGSTANQSSDAWIADMVGRLKKHPERFKKRSMQEYLDDEQASRF